MLAPLSAIVGREFKRFRRQRGRLLSAFARAFIWLFVIGSGFSGIVAASAGLSYRAYLFPGIIGMVILFSAMLAALSTVYDRELGVLRMLLIAPIPRATIVLGKLASSACLAGVEGGCLLLLVPVLGIPVSLAGIGVAIAGIVMTALALAGVGMLLASRMGSIENFAVLMNFVIFPMFFLSGGLYPVERLPVLLQLVAYVNPLTYGIDLMRHGFFGGQRPFGGELPLLVDAGVLLVSTALTTGVAVVGFEDEDRFAAMAAGRR